MDFGKVLRYGAVGLLWLLIAFGLVVAFQLAQSYGATMWLVFVLTLGTLPVGALVSHWLLNVRLFITYGDSSARQPAPARLKNSDFTGGDLRDMLHLLSADDLDDLRAELREAMRSRIRNLTGQADFESFEQLLAEPGPRERAKRG